MVIVDSSVWLKAFKNESDSFKVRIQLEELLNNYLVCMTDPVRLDLLSNVKEEQRTELLNAINQLPMVSLKSSTWNIAIQISWNVSDLGFNLTQQQALNVALALQTQSYLFTLSEPQIQVQRIRKLKLLL